MHTTRRTVVLRHGHQRAPVIGFILYVDEAKPTLLRRYGWEVWDDVHDDFSDVISHDNGRTWLEPVSVQSNYAADGGKYIHTENAAIFVPERDRLVIITNRTFQPKDARDFVNGQSITIKTINSTLKDYLSGKPVFSDMGIPGGVAISFCHPIMDRRGRILAPVMYPGTQGVDGDFAALGMKIGSHGRALDYYLTRLMIGEFDANNDLHWRLSDKVPFDTHSTSRGLVEPAIAELTDGRLVMICRGSNHMWPYKPGRKWVTFSDDGETWSHATPLVFDTGFVPESSSTGSVLIRHSRTGHLYWIGNLCRAGQRAEGNFPRSPLYIAQVQEHPFALMRETITPIADAYPDEGPQVQHTNFKVYEDRETGEFVLYLTRHSEKGSEGYQWMNANQYCYRVAVDGG